VVTNVTDQSFPKSIRVIRGDNFSEILRRGPYAADEVVVVNVRWGKTAEAPAKLGITIPKKTGNAVVRNRWKRWIREAFRTQRDRMPLGTEIIVKPKRDAVGSFAAIRKSLPNTVARAVKKLSPRI
jgi:ribonuclease P protein component